MTIVKYPQGCSERDFRMEWNVAKHDEENNRYKRSSVFQRIQVCLKRHERLKYWPAVVSKLVETYGRGKQSTIKRWVQAAKTLEPEVVATLKDMAGINGAFIFDNPYFTASGPSASHKLSVEFAKHALSTLMSDQECGDNFSACLP